MRADSLRDTIERIADPKLRTAARAEAVREFVIEAKPAQGAWATERKGLSLIFDRDPVLIRNKAGEVIGVDATVRAFRAGTEVKIDPHRVFINPPCLVPDGGVDREGNRTYREDPHEAYIEALFDSIERHPNAKGFRTRGTVTTIFSSTADGQISSANATYSTARSGSGLTAFTSGASSQVGQQLSGGTYTCISLFFDFDTSALGTDAIDAVELSLYGVTDNSATDFTIEARMYNWGGTVTTADWTAGASAGALTRVATFATSGFTTSGYNAFTEDGTNFQTNINGSGTTYITLVSSRFVAGTTPVGLENVSVRMAEQTGTSNDPKITVTHHAIAPEITVGPTVAYADGWAGVSSVASPATVTFTATDSFFTDPDDLTFQIRTATGGGGTLVTSGVATSGIEEVASVDYNDSGIVDGAQTLYLLVSNGTGSDEESFSFTRIIVNSKVLDLQWGVAGLSSKSLDLIWGVGGLARKNLILLYEVAPSPQRITYALSGEYGPVIAPLRFERRTVANVFLEDVTTAILGCQIEGNNNRTVFRTATFSIDPQEATINPLTDHIAVFTDLTVDGNYTYTMQWGLFALTIPRKSFSPVEGGVREVWEVEANDNTIHLLEDTTTETYTVASGANYITGTNAVADILDTLGLPHALPNTSATLPNAMSWPAGTPWATVVNDLLHGINHLSIKPDSTGTFRTRESTDLNTRTPDVTYNGRDMVLIPITEEVETTRFANKVIATSGNLVAVATNDDPDSPISTVTLGRTYTRVVTVDAAADQTTIEAIAAQYIRDAASIYRRATLPTQPDPRREANEVYALSVDGLYVDEKWAAQSWTVDLSPQPKPQMTHTISKVSPVAVVVA